MTFLLRRASRSLRRSSTPFVGDSKRALDEYTSKCVYCGLSVRLSVCISCVLWRRIFMGGTNTIVVHNTCEDSLLAAPIMLDLVLLMELSTRIQYRTGTPFVTRCTVCLYD